MAGSPSKTASTVCTRLRNRRIFCGARSKRILEIRAIDSSGSHFIRESTRIHANLFVKIRVDSWITLDTPARFGYFNCLRFIIVVYFKERDEDVYSDQRGHRKEVVYYGRG